MPAAIWLRLPLKGHPYGKMQGTRMATKEVTSKPNMEAALNRTRILMVMLISEVMKG